MKVAVISALSGSVLAVIILEYLRETVPAVLVDKFITTDESRSSRGGSSFWHIVEVRQFAFADRRGGVQFHFESEKGHLGGPFRSADEAQGRLDAERIAEESRQWLRHGSDGPWTGKYDFTNATVEEVKARAAAEILEQDATVFEASCLPFWPYWPRISDVSWRASPNQLAPELAAALNEERKSDIGSAHREIDQEWKDWQDRLARKSSTPDRLWPEPRKSPSASPDPRGSSMRLPTAPKRARPADTPGEAP